MKNLKVLIADDSVVYRSQVRSALARLPWIEVLGAAANGRIALTRMAQTPPDLLILDLEMPEMNGLEALKEIRKKKIDCRVIVFSSASKQNAEITLECLRLGADDFIEKPGSSDDTDFLVNGNPAERIHSLLIPKIMALFPQYKTTIPSSKVDPDTSGKYPKVIWDLFKPDIIVIGSSTGGPTVLETIFSGLHTPVSCPIVIVQHMPPVFTTTFAERLGRISRLPSAESVNGMKLEKGHIYLAPGGYHLRLNGTREQTHISLDQEMLIHSVRPAADPLFESAASIFKDRCLAFVLTGMGCDGRDGAIAVKQAGGAVVIQSEKSCAVFGMPGAVYTAGAYDKIADPNEITNIIQQKAGFAPPSAATGERGI